MVTEVDRKSFMVHMDKVIADISKMAGEDYVKVFLREVKKYE